MLPLWLTTAADRSREALVVYEDVGLLHGNGVVCALLSINNLQDRRRDHLDGSVPRESPSPARERRRPARDVGSGLWRRREAPDGCVCVLV